MTNFDVSKEDFPIIARCADRAVDLAASLGVSYTKQEALMDMMATQSNGCPMHWRDLLEADDGNFAHDAFGIRRHINRSTGKLEDCFMPRYNALRAEDRQSNV